MHFTKIVPKQTLLIKHLFVAYNNLIYMQLDEKNPQEDDFIEVEPINLQIEAFKDQPDFFFDESASLSGTPQMIIYNDQLKSVVQPDNLYDILVAPYKQCEEQHHDHYSYQPPNSPPNVQLSSNISQSTQFKNQEDSFVEEQSGSQAFSPNNSTFSKEQAVKKGKNQYDKNIVGHILAIVIKKMLTSIFEREVKFYCKHFKVNYREFINHFIAISGKKSKFGTSELGKFFNDNYPNKGYQKVFGLFLVRFLRQQYLLYILSVGKMRNKIKYMECAIKIMYIPKFPKEQYKLMTQFQ